MKDQEIIEKLKEVILPYVDDESLLDTVNLNTHLTKDLNINSANIVDIVLDVEEMFDVAIDDDDIGDMETIGSCVNILKQSKVAVS